MLTTLERPEVILKGMLIKPLRRIFARNFFASALLATFLAGVAILGNGCASYAPRSLVIRQSTFPTVMTVGNPQTIDLRIVSFNVWGLPGWMNGAPEDRYPRIAEQLEELQPDLVLLQEVWTKNARASSPAGREWSTAWSSGQANIFKENGLLTISRHPILGGEFHPFRAAALPDSLVKKGALKVTIELPDGFRLNVWNVHLQAGGADTIRSRQVAELVNWVHAAQDGQIADVVAGDFNCTPESQQYRTLLQQIGPSVQAISGEPGFTTFDGLSKRSGAGQILDHAFIRIVSAVEGVKASPRALFTAQRMKDRLSDHLGVEIALKFAISPLAGRRFESLASGSAPASVRFHAASP
jgi:endonuclease/exonuclease/phosphatase family metal-dependent hydrolase